MIQIGLLFLLCTGALAQVPGFGKCPEVAVVQNFDVSKYLGVWYEVAKYFGIAEMGGRCITANYTLNSDGSVKVVNKGIYTSITGKQSTSTIEGTATFTGKKTEGKLSVVFPSVPGKFPGPYWVLGTDYRNYAVVFSCGDIILLNAKIVWILTRDSEPAESVLKEAYKVLEKNKLKSTTLIKTSQKNCALKA